MRQRTPGVWHGIGHLLRITAPTDTIITTMGLLVGLSDTKYVQLVPYRMPETRYGRLALSLGCHLFRLRVAVTLANNKVYVPQVQAFHVLKDMAQHAGPCYWCQRRPQHGRRLLFKLADVDYSGSRAALAADGCWTSLGQ